jgi:hypothetical protein
VVIELQSADPVSNVKQEAKLTMLKFQNQKKTDNPERSAPSNKCNNSTLCSWYKVRQLYVGNEIPPAHKTFVNVNSDEKLSIFSRSILSHLPKLFHLNDGLR